MQNKKETIIGLLEGFLWSIFIGVVGISIGLGALYPPINYIAKPFVCRDGQMTFQQSVNRPTPSQTFYTADWYCTRDGSVTNSDDTRMTISPFAYAGGIYGLLCFPLFLLGRHYFKRRDEVLEKKHAKPHGSTSFPPKRN